MFYRYKNQSGQSLIELLVAMGVFILVISGIMFLTLDAHTANRQGGERTKATLLAQEGLEAATSLKDNGWRYLPVGTHGILSDPTQVWSLAKDRDAVDQYTRQVIVEFAQRNVQGDIVPSGGTADFDIKKVTSRVTWNFQPDRPSEVAIISYLTNWGSTKWIQTTSNDFNSGTKDKVVVANPPSGDGELQLEPMVAPDFYNWTFDTPGEYQFDSSKIEVVNSLAQLKDIGQTNTGQTANPGFDSSLSPWLYGDWDYGAGEIKPTGDQVPTGGYPGGWARIRIPAGRSSHVGGFIEQKMVISQSALDQTTLTFNWQVPSYPNGQSPDKLQAFVFLDQSEGQPVQGTQVWTSGSITKKSAWANNQTVSIDVRDKLPVAGTYYFKLAVWADITRTNGNCDVGFDNASITWSKHTASYPTDGPTIQTKSFIPAGAYQWNSFTETATKNGGEIYYQLSNDNGADWWFWDSSNWVKTTIAIQRNTAATVNQFIGQLPVTVDGLLLRAFFVSDGTQLVSLDNINIGYVAPGGARYQPAGTFESTPADTLLVGPLYNYFAWTAAVPVNTKLLFQLRTADSSASLSGAKWLGPDGAENAYYTIPGQAVSTDIKRWVQYKAYFSSDGSDTPVLFDTTLDYE